MNAQDASNAKKGILVDGFLDWASSGYDDAKLDSIAQEVEEKLMLADMNQSSRVDAVGSRGFGVLPLSSNGIQP